MADSRGGKRDTKGLGLPMVPGNIKRRGAKAL